MAERTMRSLLKAQINELLALLNLVPRLSVVGRKLKNKNRTLRTPDWTVLLGFTAYRSIDKMSTNTRIMVLFSCTVGE